MTEEGGNSRDERLDQVWKKIEVSHDNFINLIRECSFLDYFERFFSGSGNLKYFLEVFGILKILDELRDDPREGVFYGAE